MLEASPERTIAIVVGIDYYLYGDAWHLPGPAADALRCVEWLIGRKVLPESIHLYLSPESRKEPSVAKWIAEHPTVIPTDATRDGLVKFINEELSTSELDALFLFWGGHGVMDDYETRNYVFTADARKGLPYCVDVQGLIAGLRGNRFSRLSQQIIVIDACANPYSDIHEAVKPVPSAPAVGPTDHNIKQFLMFSASPGKFSENVSERRTGRFTEALFRQLNACESAGWPDFQVAFDGAAAELQRLGLGKQEPYVVVNWPGRARVTSGEVPGRSPSVYSLQLLLAKKKPPRQELLYAMYRRSLPPGATARPQSASIDALLQDLDDFRPKAENMPPPLVEFAERVARELSRADIQEWVDDDAHVNSFARNLMREAMDAQQRKILPRATVFLEVDGVPPNSLQWWIHAPDPEHCTGPKTLPISDSLEGNFAARLRDITAEAELAVGDRYHLMIGLLLSEKLLFAHLESTKVAFDDQGVAGKPISLNRRYPVTLHWRQRTRARVGAGGKPVNAWRQALQTLVPRLEAGGVADVIWLEPQANEDDADAHTLAASQLLDDQATEVLVGVGHPVNANEGTAPAELLGCLREGVPCFFWLSQPPANEAQARESLREAFLRLRAREVPREIGALSKIAKGADPVSLIRIVWDEPGHLPALDAFDGAPQGEDGD